MAMAIIIGEINMDSRSIFNSTIYVDLELPAKIQNAILIGISHKEGISF